MNWSAGLFFAAVVLTAGGARRPLLERCRPGEFFTEDGHYCMCPESGLKDEAICEYEKKPPRLNETLNLPETDLCRPGVEFTMGGQLCCCPANGLKTKAKCGKELENIKGCQEVGTYNCVPGSIFMDSFFRLCICSASGKLEHAICIPQVSLPQSSLTRGNDPDVIVCVPGEQIWIGNQICICKPNGILILPDDCGFIPDSESFPEEKCEPGEMYWNGYMMCICSEWGEYEGDNCDPFHSKRSTAASTRRGILPSIAGRG